MAVRIFIDGMGRIGRAIFKQAFNSGLFSIMGINDAYLTPSEIAYLLKHDSTGQIFNGIVTGDNDASNITVEGTSIPVSREPIINNLLLGELGVTIVLDCTGVHSHDQLLDYIDAGAEKALACYPARKAPLLVAYGVNHKTISALDNRISLASCSTQAASMLLQGLIDGGLNKIDECRITTVRSYNNMNQLLDNKGTALGRASTKNIISTFSNNIRGIGKVIPVLNGRCTGQDFKVPVLDGGIVELTINFTEAITIEQINTAMRNFVNEAYEYSDDSLVSSDVIGNKSAVIFLPSLTQISSNGLMVNLVGLYDNENGFAAQAIRTCDY